MRVVTYEFNKQQFDPKTDEKTISFLKSKAEIEYNTKFKLDSVSLGYWYKEMSRWHQVAGQVKFVERQTKQ